MITIPQIVREMLKNSPYLEEGLSMGVINLSALARRLKPKIESRTLKRTSVSAIIVALQRLRKKIKTRQKTAKVILPDDITVRSKLVELTYANSPALRGKQLKALVLAEKSKDIFFNTLQGLFETSIITSEPLAEEIKKIFRGEKLIVQIKNLSAITLRFSQESIYTPGVYHLILKNLAWEGINIIEVVSIHNELSLIFESSKLDQAFLTIKSLTK